MSEPTFMQRLLREKALSRYLAALERGDIDAIIAILRQSSQDAILEQMIFELHETYQTEEAFLAMVQEEHEMDFKEGIHKSLPQEELDELQAAQGMPTPEPKRYARWLQALAAILLIVLLSGGVLLYTRLHASQAANSSLARWCGGPGAPVNGNAIPILTSIAAVSPDDVWAVGNAALPNYTTSLIEHWNGKSWSVVHDAFSSDTSSNVTDTYVELSAVDALSADDVWAIGNTQTYTSNRTISQALVERWNGQTWQVMPEPAQPTRGTLMLQALSMTSDNDIWVIGGIYIQQQNASTTYLQHYLAHWDGSHWSTSQLPPELQNGTLLSVKAVAPGDVWVSGTTGPIPAPQGAVSGEPRLAHWDGHTWSITPLPSAISTYQGALPSLAATSAQDVLAVGYTTNTHGLSGTSSVVDAPFVVNKQNTAPVIVRWNGSRWSQMPLPTADGSLYLEGLATDGANNIWTIGQVYKTDLKQLYVYVAHWNGQSWSVLREQAATNSFFFATTAVNGKIWTVRGENSGDTTIGVLLETTC